MKQIIETKSSFEKDRQSRKAGKQTQNKKREERRKLRNKITYQEMQQNKKKMKKRRKVKRKLNISTKSQISSKTQIASKNSNQRQSQKKNLKLIPKSLKQKEISFPVDKVVPGRKPVSKEPVMKQKDLSEDYNFPVNAVVPEKESISKIPVMNKKQINNEVRKKEEFSGLIEKVREHLIKKAVTAEQLEMFLHKQQRKFQRKLFNEEKGIPSTPKTQQRGQVTCRICFQKGHRSDKCAEDIKNITQDILGKRKADYELEKQQRKKKYNVKYQPRRTALRKEKQKEKKEVKQE